MPPRGPRCPVNRPPGVAGAWLPLQGSRRVSQEAGRACVGWKERTAQAAPLEIPPPQEAQGSRRARTHLHTLQSRRARAAAVPARRASDSCCNSVRSSPEEPASGRRGRTPGRKERRELGLARAGTELAWLPDRGRVSAPAAPLAAGPEPARRLFSAAAKLALVAPGRRQKLSKWLTLLCPLLPTTRWSRLLERMLPCSLRGLHFVACGLAASPLGHVVIRRGMGGGGGRKRERE